MFINNQNYKIISRKKKNCKIITHMIIKNYNWYNVLISRASPLVEVEQVILEDIIQYMYTWVNVHDYLWRHKLNIFQWVGDQYNIC